jgi:iron complex transport system permease protein
VVIVRQRLTRLIVALTLGGLLGISGYALQKVMRNDLVSPSTLGVNSGAVAFVTAGVTFFNLQGSALFWPSLAGACCALLVTFYAASLLGNFRHDPFNLVLGGVISATLFSSCSVFLISLDPEAFGNVMGWMVGDIGIFDYQLLGLLWPLSIPALVLLVITSRALDVLSLGGEQATAMGVNHGAIQGAVLISCIVITVMAVTISGPIGFIGLVVPHIVRLLIGNHGRFALYLSFVTGSMALVTADILARALLSPRVLNVGTIMALVGGVCFLALVIAKSRRIQP